MEGIDHPLGVRGDLLLVALVMTFLRTHLVSTQGPGALTGFGEQIFMLGQLTHDDGEEAGALIVGQDNSVALVLVHRLDHRPEKGAPPPVDGDGKRELDLDQLAELALRVDDNEGGLALRFEIANQG